MRIKMIANRLRSNQWNVSPDIKRTFLESVSMSFVYLGLTFILTFIYGISGHAKTAPKKKVEVHATKYFHKESHKKIKTKATKKPSTASTSTSSSTQSATKVPLEKKLIFDDRLVKGKQHVPGEGIVTVENEKPILNLLSLRTDFKDRREKEKQRN